MENRNRVVVAVCHVNGLSFHHARIRVASTVGCDAVVVFSDSKPRLDGGHDFRQRRSADIQHVDRGALGDVGIAKAWNDKLPVRGDVPASDTLRVTQGCRQVPGVHLLDLDLAILHGFVGIPSAWITEREILVRVTGAVGGREMRVLKNADMCYPKSPVVR